MDQVSSLSVGRIVVGTVSWLAPEKALRAGLLDTGATQSPYLLRLFGAREVALGAVTLMAPAALRPALVKVGLGVDGSDAAAAILALRSGHLGARPALAMVGAAGTALFAGARALQQES